MKPGERKAIAGLIDEKAKVLHFDLADDGTFPNNPKLPLILYQGVLRLPKEGGAALIEELLEANQWDGTWRNGIFTYQHYHSIAHEVLAVYSGSAKVQFGGPKGITQKFAVGDVVVIPAGVAHKNLGASEDFRVIGAYPPGQEPDMCHGKPGERPQADENIQRVPKPKSDPVFGRSGPLIERWG
jgi:uncharacterized protein YjlB